MPADPKSAAQRFLETNAPIPFETVVAGELRGFATQIPVADVRREIRLAIENGSTLEELRAALGAYLERLPR